MKQYSDSGDMDALCGKYKGTKILTKRALLGDNQYIVIGTILV